MTNLQVEAKKMATRKDDSKKEAFMAANEIRTSIKSVYEMLREILALYERTECYNTVPAGEKEQDILEYLGKKLLEIRKEIKRLFSTEGKIGAQLTEIVDETEQFVNTCEMPGVVERWKQINPDIVFFDCTFDIRETCPELFQEMKQGLTFLKLSFYPDETLVAARNQYFEKAKKKMEDENLEYSEVKVFQDELLKTLTLVFEHDFKEYLDMEDFL